MWLKNEVIEGLQKLLSLRLKNTPPADVIRGTVEVWTEVLQSRPISWDQELDTKRIKTAFRELCAVSDSFPSPSDFLRILGPREQPKALPRPIENHISDKNKKLVKQMLDSLRNKGKL